MLLNVARRGHILQKCPRRKTGLVDVAQKGIEMIVFQRARLKLDATVLVEEVDGAQHRAVAGFLADFRDLCVELLLIDL